ncbi:MAG TPA: SDR family oxidoreductase [Candidatus Paceibacterota bacterium]
MILKNKIALITGASKGIGAATAIAFAGEGCSVIINFKSDEKGARKVLKECDALSKGNIVMRADISNEEDVARMFKEVGQKFSYLDVLVNNAGIFDESDSYSNLAAFDNIYKNNFLGCVMVTREAIPLMKEGKIINVSSINGRLGQGRPRSIAYSAFKAALDSYSANLAKALAPKILVNTVAPGRVATPMWGSPDAEEQDELGQVHLTKRMIQPEEVADAIVFLAKNDAMCGEVLTIDGGMNLNIID